MSGDLSVLINDSRASPSINPQVLNVQFHAQEIPGGGSDVRAVDPDGNGNVELLGLSATANGGNVILTGNVQCSEFDGNVVMTADGEGKVISDNGLSVTIDEESVSASFSQEDMLVLIKPSIIRELSGDVYDGNYDVTPGDTTITLQTVGKSMARNVTIAPVPSTYGRITWNGSFLTVS